MYFSLSARSEDATLANAVDFTIIQSTSIETSNAFSGATPTAGVNGTLYIDSTDNFMKAKYSDTVITAVANQYTSLGPAFAPADVSIFDSEKVTWKFF